MEQKYNEIIDFLKTYQKETDCKGYVIGISGGKDSTVVAKLLCDAIGSENVIGILMPNKNQKDLFVAKQVTRNLKIKSFTINIGDCYDSIISNIALHSKLMTPQSAINVAPRLRMIHLYSIAQSLGYRVAGTGNASELFIGWFTKWGDGGSDINPIAHLTCTEVIELGRFMGLNEKLVSKVPSDGLTGKSDEDNFGFTYKELDSYITTGTSGKPEIDEIIKKKHQLAYHKLKPITLC